MKLRIAGRVNDSIVDGPGFRYTVFTQGCPHRCPGCHNPHTHDVAGGSEVEITELAAEIRANPLLSGVTFSGGEPFEQPQPLIALAKEVHEMGLTVMMYSGYTFEQIIADPEKKALLEQADYLVDGPYLEAQRDLTLRFRGSKNQRILDVKQSLAAGKAIDWEQ